MRFTLTIDCDNAAFRPFEDDAASEAVFAETVREIKRIMGRVALNMSEFTPAHRSGGAIDTNGNRVGAWSLSEEEASGSDDVSVTLAERAANASHIAPCDVLDVLTEACASYPHDAFRLRSVDGDRSRLRLEAFSVASHERSRWVRIEER